MRFSTVHLWGDSLGKGVVFDEGRGRYCITPDRCVVGLAEALGIEIVNHSRMGATVLDGLADFEETRTAPGGLVVIEYGGNDCDMPWAEVSARPEGEYDGKVRLADFTGALEEFVERVRARGMEAMLVTPPPLEAQRYFDWVTRGLSRENVLAFLGDVQHIYRWQERYAVAVRNVAVAMGVRLFDMRDVFLARRDLPGLICADGIHLNAAGHGVITESVLEAWGERGTPA